jgi:hypothetical protein
LKVQITQCDEFTRNCLERQVTFHGYESVEDFIAQAALDILENLEDDIVLDPRTGEVIMKAETISAATSTRCAQSAAISVGADADSARGDR